MEILKQDLTQEENAGTVFMMQLLMEESCEMPDKSEIEQILKKHIGNDTECFGYSNDVASFAVNKYKVEFQDGVVPPTLQLFGCHEFDSANLDVMITSQMWNCPESDEILENCKYQVLACDMFGAGLYYKDRADMLMDYMEALVELFPTCKAVYFQNSGKMFTADLIRSHNLPREDRFIYFAVNVRFFNIQGTDDMMVDSLGMSALYMPDLQYHFHGLNPNSVVNHAYTVLSYIYENENPIENNHTIDGLMDERMCQEIQWKCQYEEALIQPVRDVIDINTGEFASGSR